MLAPTRERELAKIEISLLSSSWLVFLALWIVSRGHFGRHLVTLGAFLVALGAVLGDSRAFLGSSWAAPVDAVSRSVPTGVSGGSRESLGRVSGTPPGYSWAPPPLEITAPVYTRTQILEIKGFVLGWALGPALCLSGGSLRTIL